MDKNDVKIIEIACGTGRTTQKLFKYPEIGKIFCLDISEDMLNVFKVKLNPKERKKAKFILGDATGYFKSCKDKFDIIIIEGSLHHVKDYPELLYFSSQRLKNDGFYCIFGEPSSKKEFNSYIEGVISTWDRALNEFNKNNFKKILYLLYSPFSLFSPILNRGYKKKIKDRLLHGKNINEDLVKYAEYWVYKDKEGLNKKKILDILEKNNVKIIKTGPYPGYKSKFINRIARRLRINVCFYIVGQKYLK